MGRKIYVVGAGGKTSLIQRMAQELIQKGHLVAILTTTHRMIPQENGILLKDGQSFTGDEFRRHSCLEIGRVVRDRQGNVRMGYPGDIDYHKIETVADDILIEADGSKRLPVKVPASHEPVIFPDADRIYVVEGLSGLGKPIGMVCHRLELVKKILGTEKEEKILQIEDLGILMKYGYLQPLRFRFPKAEVIPVLNQADTEELKKAGRQILENIGEKEGLVLKLKSTDT